MKKLFALLLLAPLFFVACGDDDAPEEKPYFNPVEGEWVYSLPEYDYTETRIYTKDFDNRVSVTNNGINDKYELGKYSIDSSFMYFQNRTQDVISYKIEKDTLWLWKKGEEQKVYQKFIRKRIDE